MKKDDPNKIGIVTHLFLVMGKVYKQLICSHPLSKRYKTGNQIKCYNCDKVIG